MRRNRTRINRNRFDNRNPVGRYRYDASYTRAFKAFWKEFEDLLDEALANFYYHKSNGFLETLEYEILIEDNEVFVGGIVRKRRDLFATKWIKVPDLDMDLFYRNALDHKRNLGKNASIDEDRIELSFKGQEIETYLDHYKFREALKTMFSESIF